MSGTDLPKISDEDAVELLARRAWRRRHSITWESGADIERQEFLTVARLDLAALVASGYRREADVRREVARSLGIPALHALRSIPDGEIRNGCVVMDGAQVREQLRRAYLDIQTPVDDPATALEQAQPLLAAGSEVESLELVESPEGQERSEGDGRFRSCVEGILAEGCSSCGTCVDHDGCADTDHPLADGDCAACGACATCIADCARLHGRSSDG